MRRKQTARMIDELRVLLAKRASPEQIERMLFICYQLNPLDACPGAAHKVGPGEANGHQDNCSMCAPRWGWCGEAVKVT